MLRTILSENQYDPKLVTTANMNPSRRPCAPPSAWPIPINSALRTPSSNAVLITFDIKPSSLDHHGGRGGRGGSILTQHDFSSCPPWYVLPRSYRVASSPATSAARTGSHS